MKPLHPASNGMRPLAMRSTSQDHPALGSQASSQPSQPDADQQWWSQEAQALAKLERGKQRRLPSVVARPGAAGSSPAGPAANELWFPAAAGQQPVRRCVIPDAFKGGAGEYARVWLPAVYEELNLK